MSKTLQRRSLRPPSAAVILVASLLGCASSQASDPAPRAPICGMVEAERLSRPTEVRVAPSPDAALIETLQPGRFVYRCETVGGWSGLMYPRPSEPVDCTRRAAGNACAGGWTQGELVTEIMG